MLILMVSVLPGKGHRNEDHRTLLSEHLKHHSRSESGVRVGETTWLIKINAPPQDVDKALTGLIKYIHKVAPHDEVTITRLGRWNATGNARKWLMKNAR